MLNQRIKQRLEMIFSARDVGGKYHIYNYRLLYIFIWILYHTSIYILSYFEIYITIHLVLSWPVFFPGSSSSSLTGPSNFLRNWRPWRAPLRYKRSQTSEPWIWEGWGDETIPRLPCFDHGTYEVPGRETVKKWGEIQKSGFMDLSNKAGDANYEWLVGWLVGWLVSWWLIPSADHNNPWFSTTFH